MAKIFYSPLSKIISIRLKQEKSVDSDVSDNIVVDYGKNDDIVNIDIMNIRLSEFKKSHVPVEQFMKIRS